MSVLLATTFRELSASCFNSNVCARSPRAILTRHIHPEHERSLPVPPPLTTLDTPEETALARDWVRRFGTQKIPKGLVELTFSRSSGPGGQNVNKVNTKATARCSINSTWIPVWARTSLQNSPHFVSSTQSILITSSVHRTQSLNIDECLKKLRDVVVTASSAPLRNEPSEEQKQRVRSLERAQDTRRRSGKDKRSQIKKGRSSGKKSGAWD